MILCECDPTMNKGESGAYTRKLIYLRSCGTSKSTCPSISGFGIKAFAAGVSSLRVLSCATLPVSVEVVQRIRKTQFG